MPFFGNKYPTPYPFLHTSYLSYHNQLKSDLHIYMIYLILLLERCVKIDLMYLLDVVSD